MTLVFFTNFHVLWRFVVWIYALCGKHVGQTFRMSGREKILTWCWLLWCFFHPDISILVHCPLLHLVLCRWRKMHALFWQRLTCVPFHLVWHKRCLHCICMRSSPCCHFPMWIQIRCMHPFTSLSFQFLIALLSFEFLIVRFVLILISYASSSDRVFSPFVCGVPCVVTSQYGSMSIAHTPFHCCCSCSLSHCSRSSSSSYPVCAKIRDYGFTKSKKWKLWGFCKKIDHAKISFIATKWTEILRAYV